MPRTFANTWRPRPPGSRTATARCSTTYLQKYVFEPATHAEYLTRIGFERILSLYEV